MCYPLIHSSIVSWPLPPFSLRAIDVPRFWIWAALSLSAEAPPGYGFHYATRRGGRTGVFCRRHIPVARIAGKPRSITGRQTGKVPRSRGAFCWQGASRAHLAAAVPSRGRLWVEESAALPKPGAIEEAQTSSIAGIDCPHGDICIFPPRVEVLLRIMSWRRIWMNLRKSSRWACNWWEPSSQCVAVNVSHLLPIWCPGAVSMSWICYQNTKWPPELWEQLSAWQGVLLFPCNMQYFLAHAGCFRLKRCLRLTGWKWNCDGTGTRRGHST